MTASAGGTWFSSPWRKSRRHSTGAASRLAALLLPQILPDILGRRALRSGRIAGLGARRGLRHGLLGRPFAPPLAGKLTELRGLAASAKAMGPAEGSAKAEAPAQRSGRAITARFVWKKACAGAGGVRGG